MLDLSSNDYLGLARDPRVSRAAAEAATTWGAGATGSRLVDGSTRLHEQLETALARHCAAESALAFSSGYLANIGAVTALAGPDCTVVSDALNHASIIDACRLSRSQVKVVGHRELAAVATALRDRDTQQALVVTESVFSVDGDSADVVALHQIARANEAMLLVDEAHALGVVGPRGEGACAAAGISGEPDVAMTVTLSKSLGSQGGAVVGSSAVVAHLIDTARTFIFDTALAPANAAGALESLRILEAKPQLAADALDRARRLRAAASNAGWDCTQPDAAVFSILVGGPIQAVRAAQVLERAGVHVGCFRPPSVPDGVSRLRVTARSSLRDADIETAREALAAAAAEVR